MILERSREYTINMGNYESFKTGARVSMDTEEASKLLSTGQTYDQLLDEYLTDALAADLKEASELTAVRDSYVLSWKVK